MPEHAAIHVILSHKTEQPAAKVAQLAAVVAKSGLCARLVFVNCGHLESELEPACNEFVRLGQIYSVQFSNAPDFLEAARAVSDNSKYLFFLSSNVMLNDGAIIKLYETLDTSPELAGVNPIFAYDGCVAHLGTVADSQGWIHYLYEGLHLDSQLAKKQRTFQLAHRNAFMLRTRDFMSCGELNRKIGELAFFDLCIRIKSQTGLPFATVPEAVAILDDKFDAWENCGIWNSFAMHEKLPPDLIIPDYMEHVVADGLEYGISDWLWEGPQNLPMSIKNDAKLEWRRSNDPMKFLSWLGSLDANEVAGAISAAWSIPATFPGNFQWYKVQAQKKLAFAHKNGLEKMRVQLEYWQKQSNGFRHRKLRPAMRAIRSAGLYDCPLDYAPKIYDAWLEISPNSQPLRVEAGKDWPQIAVVTPVWNPPLDFLRQTIESVRGQTYGNWQFCLADDCSTKPGIHELLNYYAKEDNRIKVVFRKENGHISRATNSAIGLVDAPFTALLDHDDLLTKDALLETAKVLGENPGTLFTFSDEDHISIDNVRRFPVFKPARDRFLNYTGHLSCLKTSLLRSIGCLRPGFEGCQDGDLSFRIMEKLQDSQIRHISKILYHWRVHCESTSAWLGSKPYVLDATKKMFEDLARRKGFTANAIYSQKNFFRMAYESAHVPELGIGVLDDSGEISDKMSNCLEKLKKDYNAKLFWQPLSANIKPPMENIFHFLPYAGSHWTRGILSAARNIKCDVLLFVSSRLAPRHDCRPEQMAVLASMPHVAAVGGNIYHHGCLWHGGLYPDVCGLPFPLLSGMPDYSLASYCWGQIIRERQVIGLPWQCMAIKRSILLEDRVFDLKMGSLINADFSLNQEEKGRYTVICPWGEWDLTTKPPMQKSTELEKINFLKKWKARVQSHVLRNPNLRASRDNDWTIIF